MRTYGRQPTATPEPRSEPPAKRARTIYALPGDKNVKPLGINVPHGSTPVSAPVKQKQPAAEEDRENQPPAKRGTKRSILSYFKPVTTHLTPITSNVANVQPATETTEEKTTQPTPRPKRRLLRIRSNQSIESDGDVADDEKEPELPSEKSREEVRPLRKRRLNTSGVATRSRRVRQRMATAEVQTTLNISNQAPFSECKICDTVWNPLYPDDVKYHTKRHAAHLRAKKKQEDDF